ncbi:ribokinase [Paramaledivibacter caminithermalis]|uniref:Ribokinase n=1 Tax=Paramaledivibacter caminithermalis (strain DSM 15212 / CIP 107654 / DViRD3) TaxID=1121301 RepID=A0A1M6RWW9_PARC5|nr:ribokinase [Paramaledivibacter caminithermalis]SHK37045.1 ribokinase [Paramaledivibacter caminithermalis DSM 15212]
MKSKIVVVGSINADLVAVSSKRPGPGETVLGEDFFMVPGGKGANQAVAISRLGAKVDMVGCIGNDANGQFLYDSLKKEGVVLDNIIRIPDVSTGTAVINLAQGENSIVVIPGTNSMLTPKLIKSMENVFMDAAIVLLQLEIPIETVEYVAKLCFERKIPVILNPAPAMKLSKELIDNASYITPNEHEYKIVFDTDEDIEELLKRYPNKLLITQGDKGVVFNDGNNVIRVDSINVKVVDTTGAGDTFNGALAYALANDYELEQAILFANVAAGISVTKLGAQTGMPSLNEVINKL